jgi:lysylphosphatidylglycerol synthetase-like protein (DUF2156 family)
MEKQKDHALAQAVSAISALVLLISIGTTVYHYFENWTWIQSFYFTVCTITTVGYGDFYPTTDVTRLFTAIFVLSGVSIALTAFSILGSNYINRRAKQIVEQKEQRNQQEK